MSIEASLLAWLLLLYRDEASPSVRTFAVVLLLAGQPYLLELHMGQFTFVAVALTLWAVRRGQRASGGAALFAAIVLKTFPLVVLPALVRTRARRVLIGGLVAATVVLASSEPGQGRRALRPRDGGYDGRPSSRRREPVAGDLRDCDGVERSLDPNRDPMASGGGRQRLGWL